MRIFHFVNFGNLIYMKLYNLLVLNNIQKYKKNNVEAPRKNKTSSISKTYIVILSSQTA